MAGQIMSLHVTVWQYGPG